MRQRFVGNLKICHPYQWSSPRCPSYFGTNRFAIDTVRNDSFLPILPSWHSTSTVQRGHGKRPWCPWPFLLARGRPQPSALSPPSRPLPALLSALLSSLPARPSRRRRLPLCSSPCLKAEARPRAPVIAERPGCRPRPLGQARGGIWWSFLLERRVGYH